MPESYWKGAAQRLNLTKVYDAIHLAAAGVSREEFMADPHQALERVAGTDWCRHHRVSATTIWTLVEQPRNDAGACAYGREQLRRYAARLQEWAK